MKRLRFVSSLLLLLLSSCVLFETPTQSTGSISGRVIDSSNGYPISAANVRTDPPTGSVTTDSKGGYSIAYMPPGSYTITASKVGYASASVKVAVVGGRTTTADLHLVAQQVDAPPGPTVEPSSGGLVAFYPFDGSADDASGNQHHGTIHGATWTDGRGGQALMFDGSDDYVSVPDDDKLDGMLSLTVLAWVKSNTVSNPSQFYTILAKGDDTYRLVVRDTGTFEFHMNTAAGLFRLDSAARFNDTDWFFIAGTYDGSTCRIYVNGREKASASCSGNINTNHYDLWIGNNSQYTWRKWNGIIGLVAIYDRALTADEIQAQYKSQ